MPNYHFVTEKIRFSLEEENVAILNGWFREDNPYGYALECRMDGEKLPLEDHVSKNMEVRQKYAQYQADVSEEHFLRIHLPDDWQSRKKLTLYSGSPEKKKISCSLRVKELERLKGSVDYYIEMQNLEGQTLTVSGWCVDRHAVKISVLTKAGVQLPATVARSYRKDVKALFQELADGYEAGFQVTVDLGQEEEIRLDFSSQGKHSQFQIQRSQAKKGKQAGDNAPLLKKAAHYYQRHGLEATMWKVRSKLLKKEEIPYDFWRKRHPVTEEELGRQRNTDFPFQPLFSIVVPLYRTKEKYLRELLDSIQAQTYGNWELCLADGSGDGYLLDGVVGPYAEADARIRYQALRENLGISENTNAAIRMATGDYLVLADHDDVFAPNALFACAQALNQDMGIDVLYSDEDKIDMQSRKYFEPHFKSDWNLDLLRSMNYICHLFVVRRSLTERSGLLRAEYDGAQDHDFIFRCAEVAGKICHIPQVLYHWRCHLDSTAAHPESKLYAFEAGRKAVEEHYRRVGIPAKVLHSDFYGVFRTQYCWEERPLVSIIIPNKDHVEDLEKCLDSILGLSEYRNFEILIVENNSEQASTFAFYEKIASPKVRVLQYEGGFNFSKINNFGARHAKGDYLLLLNNDTQMIDGHCIEELLYPCMREDVGIVGARLYYEDDTVQHGGVILGFGGIAGHAFIGQSRYDAGYFSRGICTQDLSAVTAACMMTKKSTYEAVHGLTEEFEVAFNDIDYCMKVRALGQLVLYNPYAQLYHYESKSRGLEDTPEKDARFRKEVELFRDRWGEAIEQGDPYYNPNLTLDKADFSLRM